MRVIGGFIRSTPIHVMENELFLQPLQYRRHYLAGKYWLKLRSHSNNNVMKVLEDLHLTGHLSFWRNKTPLLMEVHGYLNELPIHISPQIEIFSLDTWVQGIGFSNIIVPDIESFHKAKKYYTCDTLKKLCTAFLNKKYFGFYKIYTDGSKDEIDSGAAFFDPQTNGHLLLKVNANINIMCTELIAIEEALSYIDSLSGDKFVVLSDSKSALQHIIKCTNSFRGTPVAYNVIRSICDLYSKGKTIVLQWIPGHVGLVGNETADLLAREAYYVGALCSYKPNSFDFFFIVRDRCKKKWQEYFDLRSLNKGIWYRTIQPGLSRRSWLDQANMNRSDSVLALRLRSGHIPTNCFGYLMRKVASPNCAICGKVEDVFHVLMECVRSEAERVSFLGKSFDVGLCNSILSLPTSKDARSLYKIVQKSLVR